MRHSVFYQVRPSDDLLMRLEKYETTSPEYSLLASPELWSRFINDRTAWSFEEYSLQIKVAFLANLKHLYLGEMDVSSTFTELLQELLGGSTIKVDSFDKWWLLERQDSIEDLDTVEGYLKESKSSLEFEPSGSDRVDAWLSNIIKAQPK